MLTNEIKRLITDHSAGMVASTNDDGTPSVSPKATFVIIDDTSIAFGNIRSHGTLANIRQRSSVEICFIDVICRKAVRVQGKAEIIKKSDADTALIALFEQTWSLYLSHMSHFVKIKISSADMITSPAYDLGFTQKELRKTNLERLNTLPPFNLC